MRLTDLLGAIVTGSDGADAGVVVDVRLVQDGPILGEIGAAFMIHGLVVGRHSVGAHMGFERRNVRGPWVLKMLFSKIQGVERYAPWGAVAAIEEDRVRLNVRAGDLDRAEPPR
jgi:hypothetical protein